MATVSQKCQCGYYDTSCAAQFQALLKACDRIGHAQGNRLKRFRAEGTHVPFVLLCLGGGDGRLRLIMQYTIK